MHNLEQYFPIFRNNPNLIYWDNAATTQKPEMVIQEITRFYAESNANIARGLYDLSAKNTVKYESVRDLVAQFLEVKSREVCFTSGTTDGINKILGSFVAPRIKKESNVVISQQEHHANFLPWQLLCARVGADLRIIRIDDSGQIDLDHLQSIVDAHTVLVSVSHISNVLGLENPVDKITEIAHSQNIPVLVDIAQSIATHPIKPNRWDADFVSFSGHKMFAPTGIGILYVAERYHKDLQPFVVGGGMVEYASNLETEYREFPVLFEAGTPNISGVFGLGAAIRFIEEHNVRNLGEELIGYSRKVIEVLESYKVRIFGGSQDHHGIVSFTHPRIHAHDIAQFLGDHQIAVRAGHHCAQPLIQALGEQASVRLSFSIYNRDDEIEQFHRVIDQCISFFD